MVLEMEKGGKNKWAQPPGLGHLLFEGLGQVKDLLIVDGQITEMKKGLGVDEVRHGRSLAISREKKKKRKMPAMPPAFSAGKKYVNNGRYPLSCS